MEAGVKNVFDQEYAYSAYYPEPGRAIFVGVSANFLETLIKEPFGNAQLFRLAWRAPF